MLIITGVFVNVILKNKGYLLLLYDLDLFIYILLLWIFLYKIIIIINNWLVYISSLYIYKNEYI